MLPVLKQAGVVDSGGQGLVQVLKGGLMTHCSAKKIDYTIEGAAPKKQTAESASNPDIDAQANQEIKFAYCTQFIDHAG